jgi:hypothetical protein
LQAPAANSFCEGSQDVEAETMECSEELGAASNGGRRRRPWRTRSGASGCSWEREQGKEEERGKGGRELVAQLGSSRGHLVGQGKQEVALGDVQGNSTQLLPVLVKKTKPLCTSPWLLGFSKTFQNSTLFA